MGKLVLCFTLSLFLLFLSTPGLALYPFREICSSSCGRIQNISWPFRLKGDPHYCGNPKYELICDGNATVLSMSSRKYYVTSLSYDPNELQIVDIDLAGGECRLPLAASVSPRVVKEDGRYELSSTAWASFVNCTGTTIRQDAYHQVPCLMNHSIYVTSGYQLKDLAPSCGILAMTPTIGSVDKSWNSTDHMFELLKMGFAISWIRTPKTFGYCFSTYLSSAEYVANGGIYQMMVNIILLELGFVKCVYESKDVSHIPIAVAFVMALNFILIALIGRLIVAPLGLLALLGHEFCKTYLSLDAIEKFLRNQQPLAPRRYAYKDIANFTNNFKERIGQGGFGMVFRGKLAHGQPVAVKMLRSSRCTDGEDFISEVATIGRILHVNVVRLLGFCSEGSKRALVYEYLPKGSLDKYIFSASSAAATSTSSSTRHFTWEKLNDIALGVARGIDYLHQGCDMRILHFDIKPSNILLDDDFNPKVSDFGLAKLYPKDYSIVSLSVARGTIGYIAPELVSRSFGVISNKSDVYSYGMLLLEMAGGRRNVNRAAQNSSEVYYPSWIYDRLNRREGVVGTDDDRSSFVEREPINDVERKLCKVGLWCIQMKPSDRPAMSSVLEMLEADVHALPMPPKPFFNSSPQPDFLDQSWSDPSIISESSIIEE